MQKLSENPDIQSTEPAYLHVIQQVVEDLSADMQFVGMFAVIIGGILSVTVVGALLGVPLIRAGLRIRESGEAFNQHLTSGDNDTLQFAVERLQRHFAMLRYFVVIFLSLFVLMLAWVSYYFLYA